MQFRPILLRKGLDHENDAVPEGRTNPNGTQKASHVSVPMGFTLMGHDRLWWAAGIADG